MSEKCEFQGADEACTDGMCVPIKNGPKCCLNCTIPDCQYRCDQGNTKGTKNT